MDFVDLDGRSEKRKEQDDRIVAEIQRRKDNRERQKRKGWLSHSLLFLLFSCLISLLSLTLTHHYLDVVHLDSRTEEEKEQDDRNVAEIQRRIDNSERHKRKGLMIW